jgi:Carboxypeptidase regulatory-like domain/TonB dependent receptor
MRKIRVLLIAVVVLALSYPAGRTFGQAVFGSIVGSVTDSSGAIVPGAKITITDVGKGVNFETTANDSGNYEQQHLVAGTYRVRVEAQGFQAYVQEGVVVNVDASTQVNAVLQLGAVTQTVEVTAAVPLLKTERTDVATTFSERTVEDLPIYNRNFTTFQLYSPGNQRLNGWNHAASENPQGSQQILTQGQHFAGTAFELDGTDNQDPILGIIIINPNLEAITEAKITSQDYDAEFGKAVGAVVTTQTKSGSNDIHGEAFDFERSNSTTARDPFTQTGMSATNPSGLNVPSGNWNQFGGTVGGPIKKNKVFFFGDYQGTRSHIGGSTDDRIFTAAERTGNLSDLGVPIYDPYATSDPAHCNLVLVGGNPVPLAPANRTQFPNNTIPTCRQSPQAQSLLSLFPVGATNPAAPLNPNYFGSGTNLLNSDAFDVRGDGYVSDKIHVFGRYSFQQFTRSGPGLFGTEDGGAAFPFDPLLGTYAGTSNVRNQSVAAGFDYTVSPTWLTDVRFGWHKYRVGTVPGGAGTTPATDAGIPGLNIPGNIYTSGMPAFYINSPGTTSFNFGYALGVNQCNCPLTENEHQEQIVNNWTKIHGNHTIKFGADIRFAWNLRVPSDSHRAGELTFNNDITAGPGGVGGSGYAGFLLGLTSTFDRYVSTSTDAYETQPRVFFYGQDTWRISPKLTLNLGLRWEIYKPESAAGTGLGGWLDLSSGEMRVAGEQGVNLEGNTSTSYSHLAPRAGIAYQLNPKTVIRAGYGRSYDIGVFGTIFGHTITQNLPVLGEQDLTPGTYQTAFTLPQGPPSFDTNTALTVNNCNAITDPAGVDQLTHTFTPTQTECTGPNNRPMQPNNVFARSRPFDNRIPSIDAWNLSVQRQMTQTLALTVAYVGNKGTHTVIGDNPAYNVNGPSVIGYNPNTPGVLNNLVLPSDCQNPKMLPQPCRKPYYLSYGWLQTICYFGNDSNSKYNALQVTLEKRWTAGLSFQANYTFQHADYYANNGYWNIEPTQIGGVQYGPNPSYRDQVFTLTEVYQLPFGTGKRWGSNASKLTNAIIGGWQLNTGWNWSSGLPFTPTLSSCSPEVDNGPCVANLLSGGTNGTRSGSPTAAGYWFKTTNGVTLSTPGQTVGPWGAPTLDHFGNTPYDSFRGPRFFNIDLSLFKDFKITERFNAQLQFQSYNFLNKANLGNPGTGPSSACVDCGNGGSINDIAFGYQMRSWTFGLKVFF